MLLAWRLIILSVGCGAPLMGGASSPVICEGAKAPYPAWSVSEQARRDAADAIHQRRRSGEPASVAERVDKTVGRFLQRDPRAIASDLCAYVPRVALHSRPSRSI